MDAWSVQDTMFMVPGFDSFIIIIIITEDWHCNIDFFVLFIIYPFAFAFLKK